MRSPEQPDPTGRPFVRPYRPSDLPQVYDICVRTADAGGDARGQYSDDRLMGDLFAVPYVTLEPEHAFVLDDAGMAVGYVVGTADTARFVQRYRAEWIPAVAHRWPGPPVPTALPGPPPATPEEAMLALHHRPERMLVPELAGHPAHLHIDVLPAYQGRGFGRLLIRHLLASLSDAGVHAVHLGMVPGNVAARAFYERLGFTEISVPEADSVTYLGRSTTPLT